MLKRTVTLLLSIAVLLSAISAWAVPTRVTVKVRTKDAKFLGTSMGGALVTIRDTDTGELLAKGVTAGSTGSTERIMKKPHERHVPLSDDTSAKFMATIDIDEPTRVEVEAFGPLAQRQAANTVSLTQWVIPGRDIVRGDALLLEIPGFAVDVLSPPAHGKHAAEDLPLKLDIQANVVMMCGCPLTPGGTWDAGAYEVKALVKRNGALLLELPLPYAGTPSRFGAPLAITTAGAYEITVYAFDPVTGNTGVDKTTVVVE
jgi:hypothetical protein